MEEFMWSNQNAALAWSCDTQSQECKSAIVCWIARPIRSELYSKAPVSSMCTQNQPSQENGPKSPDPFPSSRVGYGDKWDETRGVARILGKGVLKYACTKCTCKFWPCQLTKLKGQSSNYHRERILNVASKQDSAWSQGYRPNFGIR